MNLLSKRELEVTREKLQSLKRLVNQLKEEIVRYESKMSARSPDG